MVTKCARACIVSGALMSITIPSTPPVSQGHAKSPEVRDAEKTPRALPKNRCPVIAVGQEFTPPLFRTEGDAALCPLQEQQPDQLITPALSLAPSLSIMQANLTTLGDSPRNKTPSSSRRRHLGSFAMSAYTQYHSPPRRTALGTMPAAGRTVAVDPKIIPLGTKLHIEGVGIRIAEDTGRRIKGKKLDLFLSSMGACTRFGVHSRQVYILD